MPEPTIGPRCGNNPNAQLTDGDRKAIEDFRVYLAARTALRDRIAEALEQADYRPDMRRGDLADAVLPALYQDLPWLRDTTLPASADRAAMTLAKVRSFCQLVVDQSIRTEAINQARDTLDLIDSAMHPEPATGCAHCGSSGHVWDDCEAYAELVRTTEPTAEARQDGHVYLSTGCFHGDHDYCQSMTGLNGSKRPAECKVCGAKCVCRCHTEQATAEAQATVHAVPLPGSNGISACCGRPPCEFVGERVTRDPAEVTCSGAAEAQQDGAPHPPHDSWLVQVQLPDGEGWHVAYPTTDKLKALDRLERGRRETPDREWRLVRMTTSYAVEPAAEAQDGAAS